MLFRSILPYLERNNLEDAVVDMLLAAETKMAGSSDNISATCLRWEDELTDKPPLQSNTTAEVTHEALWSIAAKRAASTSTTAPPTETSQKQKTPSRKKKPETSLEKEIENLQNFLDDFLPKR